jgi:anaerobic carbon-monoxide dehydrogenase iron sulfur subunit
MEMILRISVQRCIACGKCELACAFSHGANGSPAVSRIEVFRRGPEAGTPVTCLQCEDAACAAACPANALTRNAATGAIELQSDRCIECRACVAACPFGNMRWDAAHGRVQKCDLCGGAPACVAFCTSGALSWAPVGRPSPSRSTALQPRPSTGS